MSQNLELSLDLYFSSFNRCLVFQLEDRGLSPAITNQGL